MKKILFFIAFIASVTSLSAQKGGMSVLGNIGYQTDYERFAIGGQFRYNILNNIRIAPDVTVFLPKDKVTGLDVNVNAHYVIDLKKDNLSFYPLAGFGMQNNFYGKRTIADANGVKVETDSESKTDFAFNLGAGITYNITPKSYLNAEGKFMFGDNDCAVFLIGYGYRF